MKVTLYAAAYKQRWQWRMSLDMRVDLRYWFREAGSPVLLFLDPPISLGQAVVWQQVLSEKWSDFDTAELNSMSDLFARRIDQLGKDPRIGMSTVENSIKLNTAARWKCKLLFAKEVLASGLPPLSLNQNTLRLIETSMQGRSLLVEEAISLAESYGASGFKEQWKSCVQAGYLQGAIELQNGMSRSSAGMFGSMSGISGVMKRIFPFMTRKHDYRCRRCGSGGDKLHWTDCAACGEVCAYCEECLTMGRVRRCSLLILGAPGLNSSSRDSNKQPPAEAGKLYLQKWGLSPAQTEAATAGVRFLLQPHARPHNLSSRVEANSAVNSQPAKYSIDKPTVDDQADHPGFLIWAVTGAGKTEMIFPLIETELSRGGKVLITTPRRDVVLELEPRLNKAFPGNSVVTLYGGSEQRWESGDITLATTHQLLRFWRHFDLVIIDEIDAFPYHNNPMLEYAAHKVCKHTGKYIFLSATPPAHLQKAANRKKLPHVKVCVRYHRHPLPVPKLMRMKPMHQTIIRASHPSPTFIRQSKLLPTAVYKALNASIERGAQIFVFVPKIKFIESVVADLHRHFSNIIIEGTSSEDTDRRNKVLQFREGMIRILVTTTILERGVTVPKTDVFILDSDSPLFDDAALVQMAGRAGRSNQDPNGRVYFIAQYKTKSQVKAIRQIVSMNRLAKKKGYLIDT